MRRVPLIVQGSNTECGAATLAMIATFHGHHLTLNEASRLCEGGRDGASAGAVARAARGIGLEVKAYRAAPGILSQVSLPAIAHWGTDHFVVAERVRRSRVHLVDPDRGRRSLSMTEFAEGMGKMVLTATPGPSFEQRRPADKPFWQRYLSSLLRMPGNVSAAVQVLAVTAVIQLLGLALPLAAGLVTDRIVPSGSSAVMAILAAGIVAVGVGQLLASYLRSALIVYVQGRLDTQAMIGFMTHLMRLPLGYFHRRSTGDIIMRVTSIASLRELVTAQSLTAALDIVTVAVYLVIIGVSDLLIAGVIALVVTVQAVLLLSTMRAARDRMSEALAAQARIYGYTTEAVEGITTLKASAAEDSILVRWTTFFLGWMRAMLRRTQLSGTTETVSSTLRTLTPLVVLLIGTGRVLSGDLSLGSAMALTWLAAAVVVPLSILATNGQRLQLAGAQLQRLADVLDCPPEHENQAPPADDMRVHGQIEFRDVTFAYDSYSPRVLENINLSIEPGTRVAIAGASGSGKTTLAMLLLGLYQPTSGTVHIDGHNLAGAAAKAIRGQTGTVLQEPYIFSGTIAENIAFHDRSVSEHDIEKAAALAGLHSEIMALPQGYATRLAARGTGLSGGQRQRLAIARALVRRPRLLVLDEATSHLDTVAEALVHQNLSTLDCTQLVIAHRLSTIRDADHILVLHQGKLAEQGTHRKLLAAGGHYAALVAAQVSDHSDTTAPARNGTVVAAPINPEIPTRR